ncbi:hypothetical protein C2134_11565 [Chromobacterium sinusclupearum]|uniref:Uncharacterized protein n=1 Tax=Chromobacterium sinusclupearum TaxID=2077146 RepID=A0A2K4MN49_9NEIS|nr:hypothetical protein [Chromobacterium sinusclupearum]POA98493.1 hypothetical protein C2134_11565 [Chromobacterium sinusclupearum]
MQSKSVIMAAWLGLAVLVGGIAPAHAASLSAAQLAEQQTGAAAAARQGLAAFVRQNGQAFGNRLPEGFPLDVADGRALASLRVGAGFPVYSVTPQQLLANDADLSRQMAPTGAWRFTVYQQQRPVGLVTVEKVAGRWQAVSYGAAGLAKDLESLRAAYGDGGQAATRFLRVYQAQSDFLEVTPAGGKPRFAALTSANASLQLQRQADGGAVLLDGAQLLEPLRAAVRSNLSSWR